MDEKEESTSELIVVDVKRYKRVKQALAASEERYRQLFENVPIGIYRTTPDGHIVDANPALVQMLGYGSFAELAARNLERDGFEPGYDRAGFIQLLEREGEIRGLEARWKRKDGTMMHVRENAKRVQGEKGEVFFEGTVEDITQSKLAEEAQRVRTQQIEILNCIISQGNLAESLEEMLETVLDCVTEPLDFDTAAIFLYDPQAKKMNMLAARGGKKGVQLSEKYTAAENLPFSKVLRGEPVFVDNVPAVLPDLGESWGWRMASSIPLVSKGRVIGALNAASCRRQNFSSEEKHVLELIGKEAGTLISKLQTETALRESEKYYRTLIDTSPDIIFVLDFQGILTMVNQRFLQLGGYYYDEVVGHSVLEFVEGIDADTFRKGMRTFLADHKLGRQEYPIRKKDGTRFPLEMALTVLSDSSDQPASIMGIGRDISERKRAEEQLRFLSSITENTTDAIMVTDADFVITYINKIGERFFGYTLDELRGKTPGIFNAEPNAERIQKAIYEAVAAGETYMGESLNRRKDGSTFYCEYKVMPLRDAGGEIKAYFSLQRDISERKRSEAVLRQSEETFRRTFAAIPSPAYMWVRQGDGRVVLEQYNREAEAITHGKIKDFVGIEVKRLYGDRPDLARKIKAAMSRGRRLNEEILYRFQSTGESKWLVVDYVRTAPGHVLVITRDVSERKEAESKLLAYQEQLRALSLEITLVEEKERRRIASDLHDQIGQNLALCKLKVAALEKGPGNEALQTELSAVRRLLECSIQDARSLILDLSPPVLYELGFRAALEWLAERIGEQFRVNIDFEDRAGDLALADDRQVILFQVVRELLVNVGKHSQAKRAKVILAREGGSLLIQVNDDGVGFDTARVRDPKNPKAGFGFFSVHERLNYMGGRLEVRSKPGQGSQVVLTVPAAGKGDA
ncbi:MAG: PAS domain S-box protein [Candidatus Aminicenantes bacterium]|nr:PAS domain S-box protein [Candidatus Aminicenantes bacterium]